MKHIKTFEAEFMKIDKEIDNLPIENSKFKVGDEVIFIGDNYKNPYQTDSNRCEIGEKYKISRIVLSPLRYYYMVYDKNKKKIGYIIPEDRLLYEWEHQANQYNL